MENKPNEVFDSTVNIFNGVKNNQARPDAQMYYATHNEGGTFYAGKFYDLPDGYDAISFAVGSGFSMTVMPLEDNWYVAFKYDDNMQIDKQYFYAETYEGTVRMDLDPSNGRNEQDVPIMKYTLKSEDEYKNHTQVQTLTETQKKLDDEKEAEIEAFSNIANFRKSSIELGMQNFNNVLIRLNEKFCKNRALYTMYFKMTLGNNTVLVDTTSKDWTENVFVSFTHTMNGSGEANSFTLDILFKPNDRNFITINSLEQKLLANCMVYEDSDNLKPIENLLCNCTYTYGYGDDMSLRSPQYNGTILGYKSKLDNGNLRYTITGFAGLYSAKEYRISAKEEYLTDSEGATIETPLDYILRIFEVEFAKNNLYDLRFVNIDEPSKVVYPGDDFKRFSQKNIFQVISDILSGCMTEDQYNAMMGIEESDESENSDESESSDESGDTNTNAGKTFYPNQKQIFGYYLSDTKTMAKYGTVYIYKLDSLNGEENAGKTPESITADANIHFSWFGPSDNSYNHIVKEWSPEYDGTQLMALATTLRCGKNNYYTMTDDGDIRSVKGLGAARLGINGEGDISANNMILSTIQEYDNWSFVTQYPYSAKMTILGCPCEVPLTGRIKVIAKMGTETHHSSGVYMILKKVDKISSSGFFSEFELSKLTPGYNPSYTLFEDPTIEDQELYTLSHPIYDPSVPGTKETAKRDRIYIQRVTYNGDDMFGYVINGKTVLIKRLTGDKRIYGQYIYDYVEGESKTLGYITDDGDIVVYGG